MNPTPILLEFQELPTRVLSSIVGWLTDGSVGANLRFSVGQQDSDFDTARNVKVYVENPTVLTGSQLEKMLNFSYNLTVQ